MCPTGVITWGFLKLENESLYKITRLASLIRAKGIVVGCSLNPPDSHNAFRLTKVDSISGIVLIDGDSIFSNIELNFSDISDILATVDSIMNGNRAVIGRLLNEEDSYIVSHNHVPDLKNIIKLKR